MESSWYWLFDPEEKELCDTIENADIAKELLHSPIRCIHCLLPICCCDDATLLVDNKRRYDVIQQLSPKQVALLSWRVPLTTTITCFSPLMIENKCGNKEDGCAMKCTVVERQDWKFAHDTIMHRRIVDIVDAGPNYETVLALESKLQQDSHPPNLYMGRIVNVKTGHCSILPIGSSCTREDLREGDRPFGPMHPLVAGRRTQCADTASEARLRDGSDRRSDHPDLSKEVAMTWMAMTSNPQTARVYSSRGAEDELRDQYYHDMETWYVCPHCHKECCKCGSSVRISRYGMPTLIHYNFNVGLDLQSSRPRLELAADRLFVISSTYPLPPTASVVVSGGHGSGKLDYTITFPILQNSKIKQE